MKELLSQSVFEANEYRRVILNVKHLRDSLSVPQQTGQYINYNGSLGDSRRTNGYVQIDGVLYTMLNWLCTDWSSDVQDVKFVMYKYKFCKC